MIVLYLLFLIHYTECARILAIQHAATHSHYQLIDSLLKELACRGHDVTMVTPFKEITPTKNLKTIVLTGLLDQVQSVMPSPVESAKQSPIVRNIHYEMLGLNLTEETLKNSNMKKLLKSNETFDLIILEQFLNDALRGLCHHYNAHCVTISTVIAGRWANSYVGNVGPPSVVPDILLHLDNNMNFLERLYNTVIYSICSFLSRFYFIPKHSDLLRKHFPDAPDLEDLIYNTSLLFVNSHLSLNYATSYVPNMIEIGGYHVPPSKPLPKDIKSFLDRAKDGVIYFSMGSFLQTSSFPSNTKEQLLNVFDKIKQKVLLKWHDDSDDKNRSNVLIRNWFPQTDVLAHPNIKLFITHGGLLSTTEAVHHCVPLLGIPIFGDQLLNMANAVRAGYGISLPFYKFTIEKFEKRLLELLNNPKYTMNVQKRSKIFHNRPLKPMDTAVFWVEHVLHNGAEHLKTSALRLTWYQYYLLDVIAFLIFGAYITAVFCSNIVRMIFPKQKADIAISKKRN